MVVCRKLPLTQVGSPASFLTSLSRSFLRLLMLLFFCGWLANKLKSVRKSKKGIAVSSVLKQLLCFFMDGTSLHLKRFDEIQSDDGYAGCIEIKAEKMISSHQIKRFFGSFSFPHQFLFRT